MKYRIATSLACAALALLCVPLQALAADHTIAVIPELTSLTERGGHFTIRPDTRVVVDGEGNELKALADALLSKLHGATRYALKVEEHPGSKRTSNAIVLSLHGDAARLGREGYTLDVLPDRIVIAAAAPAGIFYGEQTLYQLLPAAVELAAPPANVAWEVPCVAILDTPRFSWRGMHLDVSRHFFPKEFIKQYIDILSRYKLNMFHWHLTDDQGWRLEIKRYPRLTEVGAWRVDREGQPWDGRLPQQPGEKATYGGFYTQDDVREIVAYAQKRFITIVPEIEMPAHSVAALAAYPQYSCEGKPLTVLPGGYWPNSDIYCAGNDSTFVFLQNILTEVMDLFPGRFIHIGGDEADKTMWKQCPKCQARIREEHLKDEEELQSYFVKRIESFLSSKGRSLVGWDEILQGGIAPRATVMSWRGIQGGIDAAKSGHDVVMTPTHFCYFDYYQGKDGEPPAIGGYLPIDTVYTFDPVPAGFTPEEAEHVLGVQANLWAEYVPTPEHAEYMLLPRMLALSEVGWSTPDRKSYPDFLSRLERQYTRLADMGVNFRVPPPIGRWGREVLTRDTVFTIGCPVKEGAVRYTLDGSIPGQDSPEYNAPLQVGSDVVLNARTVLPCGRMSNNVSTSFMFVDPAVNGLAYRYYEGRWDTLPGFDSLVPVSQGRAYDVSVDAIPHRDTSFAADFEGSLEIDREGDYTFYLNADDGGRLFLDGVEIARDDGPRAGTEVSGKATLRGGKHAINVQYLQRLGWSSLLLSYEGPEIAKQPVPPKLFVYP